MRRQSWRAVLAAGFAIASMRTALPAETMHAPSFDGTWLYTKDQDDGTAIAFVVSQSSLIYLSREGHLYSFARGWWTADPTEDAATGTYHVKTELGEPMIIDGPAYEQETQDIEIKPLGPDRAEVYLAGDPKRRGVMERIACTPTVSFVDRSAAPPPGCKWSEVRGVGFDGLTGDCRWDEEWASNWDEIRLAPDGQPVPSACLLAVPVAFPD